MQSPPVSFGTLVNCFKVGALSILCSALKISVVLDPSVALGGMNSFVDYFCVVAWFRLRYQNRFSSSDSVHLVAFKSQYAWRATACLLRPACFGYMLFRCEVLTMVKDNRSEMKVCQTNMRLASTTTFCSGLKDKPSVTPVYSNCHGHRISGANSDLHKAFQ